ncbi:MAG: hypothetical protein R2831_00150 [Chitinophagaceae bacterium]
MKQKSILLIFFIVFNIVAKAQNLTVSGITHTGFFATCNNSQPNITVTFVSGVGTSVSGGTLVCTDPCGTTTLGVTISNIKWEQVQAEWIHSFFFPSNAGFTVSGISLPPGFLTYNAGCTGQCPVGITAGPGFYYDNTGGNSCCPGATAGDGNPCNNYGAAAYTCNNPMTLSFNLTFCNNILTTPTETFVIQGQSDGATGCYDINNNFSHTIGFNINISPCNSLVISNLSATPPSKTCVGGVQNFTSTLSGTCSGNTISWWDAATGGNLLGTGTPFVYDPAGTTCPGGTTIYASCCSNGTSSCLNRTAVTIPGTCNLMSITGVTKTNGTCNGNASINSVTVANASSTLTYTLNPGNITNSTGQFQGLSQTAYTITATDGSGCTTTSAVSILQLPPLAFNSVQITNTQCAGSPTGQVAVGASGGTGAYTYSINPAATQSPIGTFSGLSNQVYTITVTDAVNCSLTTTVLINVSYPNISSVSFNPILCYNGTTDLTIIAAGGTPSYTYSYNGGTYQSSNIFTNISQGSYTITVKDANNCTASTTGNIIQPTQLSASATNTPILCNGGTSTVTATAGGGTTPYSYAINGGAYQGSNSFTGITQGSYTITVKDANNCTKTTTINITQPSALTLSSNATQILCYGSTSTVTATAGGGTSPYSYAINGGAYQSSNSFTGITQGSYTITVKDANNCTKTTTINITQPSALTLSSSATPILCNGGNSTVTATATGGTTPYSYAINGGTYQSSNSFAGITQGSYTITVKDANNCTVSTTGNIIQPAQLSASATNTPILCNGGTSIVTATATGGIPLI